MWAAWTTFVCWVITRYGLRRERAWWSARREGEGGTLVPREAKRREEPEGSMAREKRNGAEDGGVEPKDSEGGTEVGQAKTDEQNSIEEKC